MPAPPGELAAEAMAVVNTEVDYRDEEEEEEDSILVDPDEEPAQEGGSGKALSVSPLPTTSWILI
jgi:hypothetical protein